MNRKGPRAEACHPSRHNMPHQARALPGHGTPACLCCLPQLPIAKQCMLSRNCKVSQL